MYQQLVPLSAERHGDKLLLPRTDYRFAAGTAVVALVPAELPRAALELPVGFARQNDRLTLIGILSPRPSTNLYVAEDGQWLGGYVPAQIRAYPFAVARLGENAEPTLCIDEGSSRLSETEGEPLFTSEGEAGRPVSEARQFFQQMLQQEQAGLRLCHLLDDKQVIEPWALKYKDGSETERETKGLYRVNEQTLNELADNDFLALRSGGALTLAYTQLLSMGKVATFQRLANLRRQMAVQQAANTEQGGAGDTDDTFNFSSL